MALLSFEARSLIRHISLMKNTTDYIALHTVAAITDNKVASGLLRYCIRAYFCCVVSTSVRGCKALHVTCGYSGLVHPISRLTISMRRVHVSHDQLRLT